MSAQDDKHEGALSGSWAMDWAPPPLSEIPPSPGGIEKAIYRLEHAMHWMWSHKQTGTARADASAITDAREELATMRAAVERCAELETALAKVTAERDAARHSAEVYRDAWAEILDDDDPEDKNHLSWERATPTEGD